MKKPTTLFFVVILFLVVSNAARGQERSSAIDQYMDDGKAIFIARCVSVGPVNKLLRANVELEVMHVVKGKEMPVWVSVVSQYGMEPGGVYLLKSKQVFALEGPALFLDSRASVVRVSETDLSTLLSLSPRIIVLRTMNLRVHHLEGEIGRINHELEALKAARKD